MDDMDLQKGIQCTKCQFVSCIHFIDLIFILFFPLICTALDRVRDDYLAESQQAVDTIQAKKSNSSNKLKI